jgi:HK97 family phage major capsid protein
MHTLHNMAGRAVCAVPAGIEIKEADSLAELKAAIGSHTKVAAEGFKQFREHAEKTSGALSEIDARLLDMEQKVSRRGVGGGETRRQTWGETVTQSDEFKSFVAGGARGLCRIEVKTVTSAANSGGALVAPDRQAEVITLPRQRPVVRSLLAPGTTTGNNVQFMRQTVYTNNAAIVLEGALKPESNITYALTDAKVQTIAHWIPASRQIVDDAPQLMSIVDSDLRYGLDEAEEQQLLLGAGLEDDLLGLVTAATAYNTAANAAGDNRADTILKAISQAEAASQLPMTGIVLNSSDWAGMVGMKGTDGHYLGAGPFSQITPTLWGRPVVETTAMPAGTFLVLNGTQAAQIFDRMSAEVLISQDHADFFVKNLLAIRAEKRLALVIKRPQALVKGSFPA